MRILQYKEIKNHSKPVRFETDILVIDQIIPVAVKLCKTATGKYGGGYALAHCQLEAKNPLTFFVLESGEAIINPVVTQASNPVTVLEGCLSLKFRPMKKVRRYSTVLVTYSSYKNNKLDINVVNTFHGKMAQVFQHEIDHFVNKYIYP